jgi:hypothetical protein
VLVRPDAQVVATWPTAPANPKADLATLVDRGWFQVVATCRPSRAAGTAWRRA